MQTTLFCGIVAITAILAAVSADSFHRPQHVELVNGSLAKAFETHYDEVFPVKRLGVNLWAAIDYEVFGEGLPGIVVGRQGWLYTDEEFNVGNDFDSNIRDNLALIDRVEQQLASENVLLIIGVVPTKAQIYPEFVGGREPARAFAHLYDELLASTATSAIPTADLRETLTDGKRRQPTYFRTDTHWTPWGAELAAIEMARVIRAAGSLGVSRSVYMTRLETVSAYRGDLFNFLPLEPYFAALLPPQETRKVTKTEAAAPESAGLAPKAADLFGDTASPDVVLIGTSYSANPRWNFAGYLKESLGEDILTDAREGGGPFRPMAAYLHSEDFQRKHPRLVIWEIPERALVVGANLPQFATGPQRP